MKIIKLIVCLLFGLMFINAGLNKFLNYMPMEKMSEEQMKMMEALMTIKWLMPLTGVIETVAGLLFIIPKTRALGAIMILPVMVGIVCHNVIFEPSGLPLVLTLFLINVLMIAYNWKKYKPMFS
ncbi:MAG: DoxX family membrane protein [Flavobacterium sp.]|nr:DoxX family membrane protein [Flavobacterium sp.]